MRSGKTRQTQINDVSGSQPFSLSNKEEHSLLVLLTVELRNETTREVKKRLRLLQHEGNMQKLSKTGTRLITLGTAAGPSLAGPGAIVQSPDRQRDALCR